ncbi:hypothetical protein Vretimale_18457 [Volvox reticuliferus]|uniref:Uncharacterized protein n=1 Tax=Volvox reticuliferus TaxID=1737510 RepID=A0A8J4LZD9_9CHLO|nr:hypothetical protein Vretifemale_19794 [Volvox reticuliferus]GIM15756.1 hypothetical protein Vretimale_18457 [Volvox reticuliferus]
MSMSGLGFWRASQEAVVEFHGRLQYVVVHANGAALRCCGLRRHLGLCRLLAASPPALGATDGLCTAEASAAATLGALAAATAELVLSFVCSVLVNISDALFVCFVLDRDSAAVTWQDLHGVLGSLPCCMAARAAAEAHYGTHYPHHYTHCGSAGGYRHQGAVTPSPPAYYYIPPPASAYGGPYAAYSYQAPSESASGGVAQLGHTIGYGQQQHYRAQYNGGYGGGGGFWGWLRSPSGSGSGLYGMAMGGGRYDRPQYPPPAVLSPPYSDHRFLGRCPSHLGPLAVPLYFGSPQPSARPMRR